MASPGATLSRHAGGASVPNRILAPHLFLLLESDRPIAPSVRYCLAGADAVTFGRDVALIAMWHREASARQLQIGVPDQWMSTSHAVMRRKDGRWVIEDAKSKNGTLINGRVESRAVLNDGDLIELGHTFFLFREALVTFLEEPVLLKSDELHAAAPGLATLVPSFAAELKKLEAIAASLVSVVLQGETGVGKEIVAAAVHRLSNRSGPFLPVNCGGLPETLIESELFGSKRGAFSGADKDRPGLVRSAAHGTLFLDEIGELPASAQVALLRVLQDGEILPIGATRPMRVDVRILAATNRDLDLLVAREQFRADLLSRISGFILWLPPVRERREDLGVLISALLERQLADRASEVSLSVEATRALLLYDWPLNIRELEKCLASSVVLSGAHRIELEHLPARVGRGRQPPATASTNLFSETVPRASQQLGLKESDLRKREQLVALLREHGGNISAVARALGKARVQVQRWIKRYQINHRGIRS